MHGSCRSSFSLVIVTLNVVVSGFPELSVAVQVTECLPAENVDPFGGLQPMLGVLPSLSLAEHR